MSGLSSYFRALGLLVRSPRLFFSELSEAGTGFQRPFAFLLISGLFFAAASLTSQHARPVLAAGVLLGNALAMPFVNAAVGFMVMTLTLGRRVSFERLFAVYAYASGVVLLVSWVPLLVYLTEAWKWSLVGMGMVKGCGFKWTQALMVIGLSVLIVTLFFWSLGPVISSLKETAA